MPVGLPPPTLAPPALTVTAPRGQVEMAAAWSSWCHAEVDVPAELRTGEDPVCWLYAVPTLPIVPTPYESCRSTLRPAFRIPVLAGEQVAISGTLAPLGAIEAEFAQGDTTRQRGQELTWTAAGAGATTVTVRTSGVHGAVVYRATVGVVRDTRPPSARVNVRPDLGRIELTIARPVRVRLCTQGADGAVTPRDLGLRPAGVVTIPVAPGTGRVALGLASADGVAVEPLEVTPRVAPPADLSPPVVTMRSATGTLALDHRWARWCAGQDATGPADCTFHPWWIWPYDAAEARCLAALEPRRRLIVVPGTRIGFGPVPRRLGTARLTVTRGARVIHRGPVRPWTATMPGRHEVRITTHGREGRVEHRAEVIATDDPRPPRASVRVRDRVARVILTRPARVSACFLGGSRESARPEHLGLLGELSTDLCDTADGWPVVQGAVGSASVVPPHPAWEGSGAVEAGRVGVPVGPFT